MTFRKISAAFRNKFALSISVVGFSRQKMSSVVLMCKFSEVVGHFYLITIFLLFYESYVWAPIGDRISVSTILDIVFILLEKLCSIPFFLSAGDVASLSHFC